MPVFHTLLLKQYQTTILQFQYNSRTKKRNRQNRYLSKRGVGNETATPSSHFAGRKKRAVEWI